MNTAEYNHNCVVNVVRYYLNNYCQQSKLSNREGSVLVNSGQVKMCADRSLWIRNTLIPRLVSVCSEFRDVNLEKCDVTEMEGNKDNWASSLFSVKLMYRSETENYQSLIIKLMLSDEKVRDLFKSYEMFSNEKLFYADILPAFDSIAVNTTVALPSSMFPKHYYSTVTSTEGIIVLEDLRQSGFRLGGREVLTEKECRIAMTQLGEFHAFSYAYKIKDSSLFYERFVSGLFDADMMFDVDYDPPVYHSCCKRVINVLEKENFDNHPLYGDRFVKYKKITSSNLKIILQELLKPKEPLAVICHGDFCRNNMMFKYGEDNNASAVKFFDLQKPLYISPAIDIIFFLYMCAPVELLDHCWSELLSCYHDSLWQTLKELTGITPDNKFGREAFELDLAQHALHGYLITMFFLPWMLVPPEDLEEVSKLCSDPWSQEFADKCAKLGGEEVTMRLVSLTKHLLKENLLLNI